MCVLFSGGQVPASLTLAMSLSTEHLVLLGTPGRLPFRKMAALEDNGFLVASRLFLLKSLAVNLRLFFEIRFLRPCWLFATKRLMVLWSPPNILAITLLHPSERIKKL